MNESDDDEDAFAAAWTDCWSSIQAHRKEAQANYEAAIAWRERGYNVVPKKATDLRHPGVKWAPYQNQLVTLAELQRWKPLFANGVGFITGAVSGIIVIDTDGSAGETILKEFATEFGALPRTLVIRSGSGRGFHRHFKHPGCRVTTVANTSIKLDIKGDGGFCVLPPSLHKSGGRYEVVRDAPIAALPAGLIEYIGQRAGKPSRPSPEAREGSGPSVANNNVQDRVPLNRHNIRVVLSMFDALPDIMAADYGSWLRVGFALHAFDSGKVGVALFKKFSARCPAKATVTDFDAKWAGFGRPYEGRAIGIGTLWKLATDHGWRPIHFTTVTL
jgi:hypothetical protein